MLARLTFYPLCLREKNNKEKIKWAEYQVQFKGYPPFLLGEKFSLTKKKREQNYKADFPAKTRAKIRFIYQYGQFIKVKVSDLLSTILC